MTDQPAPSQFALLKTRRFLPLFLVLFLGAFNDQVFKNAYIALVTFAIAVNSTVAIFGAEMSIDALSLVANILFILPFALISPTAGQITDNIDKRSMIRFVKISEVAIMVLAVICFYQRQVELLLLVLFLLGAQSAVFAPVKYAVMPQYLSRAELLGGNGLAQAATFLAIIFGTVLGTQVILFEGGIFAVSAIVMLVAAIGLVAAFAAPSAPPEGPPRPVDWVLPRAMVKLVWECRTRR
ncbi:MAG: MFS transporter, partial [Pseudomonadota bacterium]